MNLFHPSIQIKHKNVLKSNYSHVTINLLDGHNIVLLVPRPWSGTLRLRCNNEPEILQSWPQGFFTTHQEPKISPPSYGHCIFTRAHFDYLLGIKQKKAVKLIINSQVMQLTPSKTSIWVSQKYIKIILYKSNTRKYWNQFIRVK